MSSFVLTSEEWRELLRATQALARPDELSSVLERVCSVARRLTRADGITFVLHDKDEVIYAEEDAREPLWKGNAYPDTGCVSGWSIIHHDTVVIDDVYADPRVPHEKYRNTFVRSLAMVPVRRDAPIGAIGAYWASRHAASAKELFVLEALANAAAGAVENAQLYRDLRAASLAKDEFFAVLGHELRNPLAPIRTAIDLIRLRDDGRFARELAVVERQQQHLLRLVDDLFDASRVARGKVELERECVDVAEAIDRAVEWVTPLLEKRRNHLRIDVTTGALFVHADRTRLPQVIANLLSNASKYSSAGSEIAIQASREGRDVAIRVQDHGIGIAPEMLDRVFDAFVQERQALDRAQGGLGLGLAIARGLVEQHGGTLEARSEGTGHGATFIARLPALEPQATASPEQRSPSFRAAPAGARRVLVVDDNEDAATLLASALEGAGYLTEVAFDAPSALAKAPGFRPEIALLDIGLPVIDGYELARRLRQLPDTADLHLVAVTGYGQKSDSDHAIAAGFEKHLVKPVDLPTLLASLAELAEPASAIDG